MYKLVIIFVALAAITLSFFGISTTDIALADTDAPLNLTVSKAGDSLTLRWSVATSATGYKVYIDGTLAAEVSSSETSLLVSTYVTEAKNYTFGVAAVSLTGTSATSELTYGNYIQYSKPSALSVDENKMLTWAGDDANYKVLIDGVRVAENLTAKSFDLSGLLVSSKTYSIKIQAQSSGFYTASSVAEISYTNLFQLSKAANLAVCAVDNTVYASWQQVPFATSYAFTIDGSSEQKVSLTVCSNRVNITEYIADVDTYTIKVCALAESGFTASEYTSYIYNTTSTLATPTLTLNGSVVSWVFEENALSYSISVNDEVVEAEYTSASFDVGTIATEVGSYSVQANSNGCYLQSQVSTVKYLKYCQLSSPELTLTENILSWNAVTNAINYTIYFNDGLFSNIYTGTQIDLSAEIAESGQYTITVSANANGFYTASATSSVQYGISTSLSSTTLDLIDTTVHWQAVLGAESYTVSVDGVVVSNSEVGTSLDLSSFLTGDSHTISVFANATETYLAGNPATITYTKPTETCPYVITDTTNGTLNIASSAHTVYILQGSVTTETNITVSSDGSLSGSDTSLLTAGVKIFVEQDSPDSNSLAYIIPMITIGSSYTISVTETEVELSEYNVTTDGETAYAEDCTVYFCYNGRNYCAYYKAGESILLPVEYSGDCTRYGTTEDLIIVAVE